MKKTKRERKKTQYGPNSCNQGEWHFNRSLLFFAGSPFGIVQKVSIMWQIFSIIVLRRPVFAILQISWALYKMPEFNTSLVASVLKTWIGWRKESHAQPTNSRASGKPRTLFLFFWLKRNRSCQALTGIWAPMFLSILFATPRIRFMSRGWIGMRQDSLRETLPRLIDRLGWEASPFCNKGGIGAISEVWKHKQYSSQQPTAFYDILSPIKFVFKGGSETS